MIQFDLIAQRGELGSTSLSERLNMLDLIAKEGSHVRPHCQTDESCSTSLPYR
jgi:hypothetical protein